MSRHVDASLGFRFLSPNEQRREGWVGYAAKLYILCLSFSCSADHERDRPPYKIVFLSWQPIRSNTNMY